MNFLSQQKEAINKLNKYKVGALFMEPGTGKTRTAVELVNSVPGIDHILYLAPLRTIDTFCSASVRDEVNKWGGFNAPCKYVGVESISLSERIYLETLSSLSSAQKPFVVCDESIKIKNFDAKRTKRILNLAQLAEYKLILNGTPISRNLLDIWSQFEFLSPQILSMSLRQFKNTFCYYTTITKRIGNRKYSKEFITGYENIDYLHSLIGKYVYHCDLKLELSKQYFRKHYVVGEEERAEYDRLKTYFLDDETLQWRNHNIFIEMTQKMQHAYCCTQSKIAVCKEIFKEEADENRTIIFCKYVDSQNLCKKLFSKATVLSYQTGALGLNLQKYCFTIYFDKMWDYYLRKQSGNRTYREGQKENCRYFDLDGDVGLESMINRNIEKKVGMVEYFKSKSKTEIVAEL